ncbi:MAG: glycosyltransferase family 4 protein [Chthoniobacterales bacterium]
MAETFCASGCEVDIVDRNDLRVFPKKTYDFAIDIHQNFSRWADILPFHCQKILHATGAHWMTQNLAEMNRLIALRDRREISLTPRRQSAPNQGIEIADCVTVLGNVFTVDSFAFSKKPIHRIPISSAYQFDWPDNKNWDQARKKFLWLGSFGMVHKGLDLVLETFSERTDLELTVCGRPEKEDDFFSLYKKELTKLSNIHLAGWVDPASDTFEQIRQEHGFILYPSCSEGGGGAVIHTQHAGLLPVVTPSASVDIENFGVLIRDGSLAAVREAVDKVANFSASDLKARSRASWEHVRQVHTLEAFKNNYQVFVNTLLNNSSNNKA